MDFKKKTKIKRVEIPNKDSVKSSRSSKQLSLSLNTQYLSKKIQVAEKVAVGHARKFVFEKFSNLQNIRNLVIVWLFLMGGLLISVYIFRVLGQSSYKGDSFTDGGLYSEGIVGEVKTLNPIFATTDVERSFAELAFSQLFDIDSSGELNTEVAQSVSTSDNYKNFVVKMHENISWSDSEKLSADDVIFTINLLKNKIINPSNYSSWANVKVAKKSDFEVEFSMPTASNLVLHSLNFWILPEHKFKDVAIEKIRENSFSKNPVTSGKFTFDSISSSGDKSRIMLKRNGDYFKGASKLNRFEIVAFSDENSVRDALIRGDISGAPKLKLSDTPSDKNRNIEETKSDLNRIIYAFMNNSNGVFKDRAVRKAVQKGLDVSKITSRMYAVSSIDTPVLPEDLGASQIDSVKLDLAAAQKYLEDAGWVLEGKIRRKDGQNMKIVLSTVNDPNLESAANEVKNQLENLGFEVQLIVADKNDQSGNYLQSVIQPRAYDILISEIDYGADSADIYPFWHSSQSGSNGLNFSNYSDAVSNDILNNIRRAKTPEEQKESLAEFSKRWLNQAPAIAIARSKTTYLYRKGVKTYSPQNTLISPLQRYNDVEYWQVNKSALYKTQ